jgi:hypothetical protein
VKLLRVVIGRFCFLSNSFVVIIICSILVSHATPYSKWFSSQGLVIRF